MTRLDAGQAAQLGMSAWRERYPPLVIVGPGHAGPRYRRLNSGLILAPVTRYCPDCLAGDGSAIQESFGGPWLKTWHLPVVFACTAHQRLLEHLCPDCGQSVRAPRPGTQFSLLPATRAAALHPAQCRTELADLQAIGLLACSTWPAARHLSPSETTAAAIDEHVDSLKRQTADRQRRAPASSTSRVTFSALPADAAASAGLAHIADRILSGSAGDVREQLHQLLPASTREVKRTVWARRVTSSFPSCSVGLQDASGPLLRGFTKAAGHPQGRRNAVLGPQRWGPENIPAFLPQDWHARH